MYLEEWALERDSGASAKAFAACWGVHRSTHWRWARRPEGLQQRRPPRLSPEKTAAVIELDRRYRSSWDARAIAHVLGLGKSTVARILREARGPRPEPRKAMHARRTRFLARDVMWSSDYTQLPDGRKLLKTLDEMSRMRLAWDVASSETARSLVEHARQLIERMGRAPLVWKYDHGSAFTSAAFQGFLAEHGIAGYPIPPRAPWANGRSERDHREIASWLAGGPDAAGHELERQIDDGMLMLNFEKPRAVLGYRTSARVYFEDWGVDNLERKEFASRLRAALGRSRDERLQRRAIRTILADLKLYEEWLQPESGARTVNRTQALNVAI